MTPNNSVTGSGVRKYRRIVLAFFWIFGLFGGFFYFLSAAPSTASVMSGYFRIPVSIVRLLVWNLLPCVFSAAAVLLSAPWLLILICFGKAFLFAYVSLCFACTFGSAGWLIWLLVMLPDLLTLPLLYFYWLRHFSCAGSAGSFSGVILFCGSIFLCSLDYRVISPFLASLFDHFSY